jgi:UDP-N-acetylglucosamine acyltransferase
VASERVAVHSTAVVAPGVRIGAGTIVGPFAVLLAPCSVGRDCWIGPHVVIGTTAEDLDLLTIAEVPPLASRDLDADAQHGIDEEVWFGAHGAGVIIGDRSTIREQCTVHQGTERPTMIGDDVFVMNKSHIGHDGVLGDRVRLSPGVNFAGHVWAGADANIGMTSAVHQHRAIGAGAMIGMNSTVVSHVGPFQLVKGTPARASGLNVVGMRRLGYVTRDVEALRGHYDNGAERPSVFDPQFDDWERARDSI